MLHSLNQNRNSWFYRSILRSVKQCEDQIPAIGIIGVFGLLAYYYVWTMVFPQSYDNLGMRIIGSLLCLGLVFKHYWPETLQKYFPFWWYATAFYILPFLSTFLLLKNNYATVPLLVSMMSLFLLILIVDWISINILFFSGVTVAWFCYSLTTTSPVSPMHYLPYFSIYLFTILAGSVLSYKSSLMQQKKLEGMTVVGGSIAHELRTPLLGIKSGAGGLKRYLPILFDGYSKARKAGLDIPHIRDSHYISLFSVLERMEKEAEHANTMIDMVLFNVSKFTKVEQATDLCTIVETMTETLDRYPFASAHEWEKIKWDNSNNFNYIGSQLLIVHVLFNLLKNALYFTAKRGSGEIYISQSIGKKYNELHFKDTGPGISNKIMPRLFDRFFSTTSTGSGVGLSFCKMVMEHIGGRITCHSIEGKFTEFVLYFPKTP